mgnify:FL=1
MSWSFLRVNKLFIIRGDLMKYWIWLASVEGLGPVKKFALLNKFETAKRIYNATEKEILKVDGMSDKIVQNMQKAKDAKLLEKYEKYILKNDIKIINISDDNYPAKLKNIYAPPITIFAKGDISLLNSKSIAIVGSREPSKYGIYVAEKFSKELSKEGITIVSGLARGIDTFAHVGALSSFGKTIAVLGSGIDVVYPKENAKYYREISEKGLIISEYIVGTAPESKNFPQRNRIISGLSDGVLVVEARKNSGTMITTDFALEQGKELYVIPGNITSNLSAGTNNLIKEGAKLVTDVYEILEDLNC